MSKLLQQASVLLCIFTGIAVQASAQQNGNPNFSIGNVDVFGELALRIPLVMVSDGATPLWAIYVEHSLKTVVGSPPKSELRIRGINAFVVPSGRTSLVAEVPGAGRVIFAALAPSRQTSTASGVVLRQGDAGTTIQLPDRRRWTFVHGVPHDLVIAPNLTYRFETKGGALMHVTSRTGQDLYTGDWDEFGLIEHVGVPGSYIAFSYTDDRQLESATILSGYRQRTIRFYYRDGLLSRWKDSAGTQDTVTWSQDRRYYTGAIVRKYPVYVSSLGDMQFSVSSNQSGIQLDASDSAKNKAAMLSYNPLAGRLVRREWDGTEKSYWLTTDVTNPARGKIERITDAQGQTVARFHYDSAGALVTPLPTR